MFEWSIESKIVQLKFTWKISRNASVEKHNFYIHVKDGMYQGVGEVAPNIRYNETPERIETEFKQWKNDAPRITSLLELDAYFEHREYCNAFKFGVESAMAHLLAAKQGISVAAFLGLSEPSPVATAFTLPIMEPGLIPAFYKEHELARFSVIKVKVDKESADDMMKVVASCIHKPLMIDANEAWPDPDFYLRFEQKYKHLPLVFIEQPFPKSEVDAYTSLRPLAQTPIFADESVTDNANMEDIKRQFHGVNMKLMKAGGYRNGLRILKEAKNNGLSTMVGCMVETSLGIYSGFQFSSLVQYVDLDGFLLIKDSEHIYVTESQGIISKI